jgi:hypothetical protein
MNRAKEIIPSVFMRDGSRSEAEREPNLAGGL